MALRWWEQSGIDWEKAKAKEKEDGSDVQFGIGGRHGGVRGAESRASGSSGAKWSGAGAYEWA